MFKNMKLWLKISLSISILTIVGLAIILFVSTNDTRNTINDNMGARMVEMANHKATVFKEYYDDYITFEKGFAATATVKNALENPDDKEVVADLQASVSAAAESFPALEGFFVMDTDSVIIAHSNTPAVGAQVYGDDRKDVLELVTNSVLETGICVRGITVSTSTGELVANAFIGVFDGDELIGFVSGGFFVSDLKAVMDTMTIENLPNATEYVIDLDQNTYVMAEDDEMLSTEVTDPSHLEAIAASENADIGIVEASDENGVANFTAYYKLADYNFLVLVANPSSDIFASVNTLMVKLIIIILAVLIILVVVTVFVSRDRKSVV